MIFTIAMGANYSFYDKSIATYAPTFLEYKNSVLAIVHPLLQAPPKLGGQNLPTLVGIGLIDLPNIEGGPNSGITLQQLEST